MVRADLVGESQRLTSVKFVSYVVTIEGKSLVLSLVRKHSLSHPKGWKLALDNDFNYK
jgi:hypothetical protein